MFFALHNYLKISYLIYQMEPLLTQPKLIPPNLLLLSSTVQNEPWLL